jgi:hypothetical protein
MMKNIPNTRPYCDHAIEFALGAEKSDIRLTATINRNRNFFFKEIIIKKIVQILATPLVTFAGVVMVLLFVLALTIGLIVATLKEIIKYFNGLLESCHKNEVVQYKEHTITIIPIIKKL